MLRLRRKAASFSNSNIKWPARFHGMLPHPCVADLAAIRLLIARRGALSKRQGRVVTGEQVAKALLEAVLTAKTGTHIIESENLRYV
jgi:hypothetical protein